MLESLAGGFGGGGKEHENPGRRGLSFLHISCYML